MNFGIRFRLAALTLAMAVIAALIVLITLSSRQQVSELRARLADVDMESSGVTLQFKQFIRELNSFTLRYGENHEPAIWQASLAVSQDLQSWIREQTNRPHTTVENALLKQIQAAGDDYRHAMADFHAKVEASQKPGRFVF